MKAHRIFAMAASGLLALSASSIATPLGFAPEENFSGYAFWDQLGTIPGNGVFSGYASEVSSLGLLNVTLSQTRALTGGGAGANGTDYIYTSSGGSTWVIEGETAFEATSLTLQVKFTTPAFGSSVTSYFSPTLTIGGDVYTAPGVPSVFATGEVASGQNVNVVTWVFDDLDLFANTSFRFDFQGEGGHVLVDGFAVGADAIPEPSAWVAMVGGASLMFGGQMLRRRK